MNLHMSCTDGNKKLLELYVLVAQNTPRLHGKFPDPHGGNFEFKRQSTQTFHRFSCILIVLLIALYTRLDCPDIPEAVLVIVRRKQMVVVTITKIEKGGPGWRAFAETVLVIVRQREDGIGVNNKDRKWENAPGWILSDSILRILTQP